MTREEKNKKIEAIRKRAKELNRDLIGYMTVNAGRSKDQFIGDSEYAHDELLDLDREFKELTSMKVSDLIEELKQFNPNSDIVIDTYGLGGEGHWYGFYPVKSDMSETVRLVPYEQFDAYK
jgi:hypothetical protein